jgi:hypothetical protein
MPVRHARSETRGRPPFGRRGRDRQERFDKIPQHIRERVAAILRSRYLAEEDKVSEVYLESYRCCVYAGTGKLTSQPSSARRRR